VPHRPCLGCGRLTRSGSRCPSCAGARARERAELYDHNHRAARTQLALTLPAPCGYGCGTVLQPDSDWVAAHVIDRDPSAGWIAACRSCNERAKG